MAAIRRADKPSMRPSWTGAGIAPRAGTPRGAAPSIRLLAHDGDIAVTQGGLRLHVFDAGQRRELGQMALPEGAGVKAVAVSAAASLPAVQTADPSAATGGGVLTACRLR